MTGDTVPAGPAARRRPTLRRKAADRKRPKTPDGRMPVMDHLRELRRRVVLILVFIAIGAVLGYYLYPHTLAILRHPYCAIDPRHRFPGTVHGKCELIYTNILDGFTTRLKVSVITGAVFTAPLWLYQVWAFITPGLHRNERRYTIFFIVTSTLLFAAGMSLAYFVLTKGLNVLVGQSGGGTAALLTVSEYISFVTLLLVVFGSAFELPLIVVLANFAGVLPARILVKSQRIGIFLIFLFAAVATPTVDPFTMCAMAIPMVLLFEGAVLAAVIHDRRKAARRAAERTEPHLEDHVPSSIDPIPAPLPRVDRHDSAWSDST